MSGKALGGLRDLLDLIDEVERRGDAGVARRSRRCSSAAATSPSSSPNGRSRPQGRIENLQELIGVCREFDEQVERRRLHRARRDRRVGMRRRRDASARPGRPGARAGVPRGDLARHRYRRRSIRETERGHADDAALGQGPRVPGRVPHRSRGRRVPARAQPRRSRRARRGTAPLLRRHHTRRASGSTCATRGAACCSARPTTGRRAGSSTRSRRSSCTTIGRSSAATARVRGGHRDAVVASARRVAVRPRAGGRARRGADRPACRRRRQPRDDSAKA